MYYARLVCMGPDGSNHGEIELHDHNEQRLEYAISFYKWQIEFSGFWCDITRFEK